MDGNLNGLELLKEEMDSDDIQVRINAICRVRLIVQTMSGDMIGKQLISYLDQLAKKEEDEVLFALAEELGEMVKLVNGSVQLQILEILEYLSQVEETLVRQKSVESIIKMIGVMNEQEVITHIIPIVIRLANNENNFTSRVSAVNIIPKVYSKSGKMKEQLRAKFNDLSHEETPMVKRAVALKIGEYAQALEKQFILNELIQQFKDLANDDQDSVRVNSLSSLSQIVSVLTKDLNKTHILPMLIQSTEDKSWKIRHAFALNYPNLINAFGAESSEINLVGIFSNLLRDNENEVKLQALRSLNQFINQLSNDKIASLVPGVQALYKDPQNEVRQGVCDVTLQIMNKLKKDTQLLKFQQQMLQLAEDDGQEVRIKNLKVIAAFVSNLGADQLASFIPILNKAKNDNKWRIRLQTLQSVIQISCEIKNFDQFIMNLEPIIIQSLKDQVFDIRQTGIQGVAQILAVYQQQWMDKSLLIKLSDQLNPNNKYLLRITAIQALESAIGVVSNDYFVTKIMPVFVKGAKDSVGNVKIAFAKSSKKILKVLQNSNTAQLKQILSELSNEQDIDISYFSKESLSIIA